MTALQDWVTQFTVVERPIAIMIDDTQVLSLAIAAANRYAAYGALAVQLAIPVTLPTPPAPTPGPLAFVLGSMGRTLIDYATETGWVYDESNAHISAETYAQINPPTYPAIDGTTDITVSEWAVIKPLFMLYVERENALPQEASRQLGIEVYGRTMDQVQPDIDKYEENLPKLAFSRQVLITI